MSNQCKEKLVAGTGGWGFHRCYNKAKKDGWCMVHHPDSVAKRDKKAKELSEQNWADSPSERLRKANDRIKEQQAQIDDLKLRLESAVKQWTELEAQVVAGKNCQRYTAESFVPATQFIQFTTQPDGELMLTADVLAALEQD